MRVQRWFRSLYPFLVVFIQNSATDDFATILPLMETAFATDSPDDSAQDTDLASTIDKWNCRRPYGYSESSCTSKCFAYPRCPWNFDASCRNCTFHAYLLPRSLQALSPLKLSRQFQTEGRAPTQVTPAVLGHHWWKAIIGAFLVVLFIAAMTCLMTIWRKRRLSKPLNQCIITHNGRAQNRVLPTARYSVSTQLVTTSHAFDGHATENALNMPHISGGYAGPANISATDAQEAPSKPERTAERRLNACSSVAHQPSPEIPGFETTSRTADLDMPMPVIPPPDYDVLKPATQSRTENVTRHFTEPV